MVDGPRVKDSTDVGFQDFRPEVLHLRESAGEKFQVVGGIGDEEIDLSGDAGGHRLIAR